MFGVGVTVNTKFVAGVPVGALEVRVGPGRGLTVTVVAVVNVSPASVAVAVIT